MTRTLQLEAEAWVWDLSITWATGVNAVIMCYHTAKQSYLWVILAPRRRRIFCWKVRFWAFLCHFNGNPWEFHIQTKDFPMQILQHKKKKTYQSFSFSADISLLLDNVNQETNRSLAIVFANSLLCSWSNQFPVDKNSLHIFSLNILLHSEIHHITETKRSVIHVYFEWQSLESTI